MGERAAVVTGDGSQAQQRWAELGARKGGLKLDWAENVA